MRILTTTFAKLCLVVALLVALASTGFAHRVIPVDVDRDLLEYLVAGGSLDEVCGDASGDHVGQSCDACRLVDSASVPTAAAHASRVSLGGAAAMPVLGGICHLGGAADPSRPVRAPPVV
ncbi:hypothetical protein [Loktanella sp. Alg231-35]|uniref:hypothetical protein n=1 Tax=Loktanella sp. Alg231-35 TaxID=1922220 RepID=UPI000D55152A|nr:hypothetical protein [Loktanella sp. Alg231-35]